MHCAADEQPVDRQSDTVKLTNCCLNRRTNNECYSLIPSFLHPILFCLETAAAAVVVFSVPWLMLCAYDLPRLHVYLSSTLPHKHCSQSLSFFCQAQIRRKRIRFRRISAWVDYYAVLPIWGRPLYRLHRVCLSVYLSTCLSHECP